VRRPLPGPTDSALRVEIITLAPLTIIAKRRVGACPIRDLGPTFGAVWSWAASNGHTTRVRGIYGLPLDDDHYDAGFDFGPDLAAPDGMHLVRIDRCECAQIRMHGPYENLEPALDFLYGGWLPQSGREPADVPLIHRFYNDPDNTPESDLVTDLLLPLRV